MEAVITQDVGQLFLNGAIGAVALYVLNRILSSFIEASSKDRESQNQAIQTLASLIGTISSQIDLNRQVVDKNNDLIERTNLLITQMATIADTGNKEISRQLANVQDSIKSQISEVHKDVIRVFEIVSEDSKTSQSMLQQTIKNTTRLDSVEENLASYRKQTIPGVIVYDNKGVIVAANDIASSLLKRPETVNDSMFDIMLADGSVLSKDMWPITLAITQKKATPPMILGIYNSESQGRDWLSVEAHPILDLKDEVLKVVLLMRSVGRMNMTENMSKMNLFGNGK